MDKKELYHYGVKGMKWGVRKAQAQTTGKKLSSRLKLAGRNISKKAKVAGNVISKKAKVAGKVVSAKAKVAGKAVSKKTKEVAADLNAKHKAKKADKAHREREKYLTTTNVKKLTSEELAERARILAIRKQALDLEKSCKNVNSEMVNSGKAFVKDFAKGAVAAAAISAGNKVLSDYFTKVGKNALGLKDEFKDGLPSVKTWDDIVKKQTYETNKKKAQKEAAAEKAAAEKAAAAQKLVDDYNAQWLKGKSNDSVTRGVYSVSGKDLTDATERVRNSKTESHEGYNGKMIGGPTAKTVVNDHKNDSINSTSTALVKTGQSYVDGLKEYPLLLLEDHSKK